MISFLWLFAQRYWFIFSFFLWDSFYLIFHFLLDNIKRWFSIVNNIIFFFFFLLFCRTYSTLILFYYNLTIMIWIYLTIMIWIHELTWYLTSRIWYQFILRSININSEHMFLFWKKIFIKLVKIIFFHF